jgi:tripartite-type tricarboxylate transporter receptor subunit TctC
MQKREKKCLGMMAMGAFLIASFMMMDFATADEKSYPNREVTVIAPAPPGGSVDLISRVIAQVLTKMWGQQVLIVNKPGANQTIGLTYVAGSKPDGYTLCFIVNPQLAMKKLQDPSLPYSPEKLTWLGCVAKGYFMLTVRADSPWKTFEEFVDFGIKNPGKIIFGTDGAGGQQDMVRIKLADLAGMKQFTPVHFPGSGPMITSLLGGHLHALVSGAVLTGKYVQSGDLRHLATLGPERDPEYPNTPTAREKGVNVIGRTSGVFCGPQGIPHEIVEKLTTSIKKAAANEEVLAFYKRAGGYRYSYNPPEECLKLWKEDEDFFAKDMKKYGFIK